MLLFLVSLVACGSGSQGPESCPEYEGRTCKWQYYPAAQDDPNPTGPSWTCEIGLRPDDAKGKTISVPSCPESCCGPKPTKPPQ